MKELKLYIDTLHGIKAYAHSKNTAWMLIRGECHRRNIEVPTIDKIVEL